MIVPTHGALIGKSEKDYMHQAVDAGWLTSGPWNQQFERKLKDFIGTRHLLTCNSGSSANLLAFMTLTSESLGDRRIKPGDEVITVACGFPTTVNPIIQAGCVPVFCDITIPEYNIAVTHLERAFSNRTKAVVLAHTLGNPFDEKFVKDFCDKRGLWLVVDCCDALGATGTNGHHVGTFGDIATLSFFPAHHITTGEGGAVFTDSKQLAKITESFRDWGRDCYCKTGKDNTCKKRFAQQHGGLPNGYDHKYTYTELGYNLKLSEIPAACGVAQMERIETFVRARQANFSYLLGNLWDLRDTIQLPFSSCFSSPFGFPITCKPDVRQKLIKHLDERGIGTRLLFGGNLTKQPYMKNRKYRVVGDLKNTNRVMNDMFWIGCWPGLTQDQLDHSIKSIWEFFQ